VAVPPDVTAVGWAVLAPPQDVITSNAMSSGNKILRRVI
jgi:hypothetical protein